MTSEYEHTTRQRPSQQAQGRKRPILVLLLGLAALALALTACGDPSSTSGPDATGAPDATSALDATGATRVPEWEETVEFSVEWLDTHLVEIPVEKCEQVKFHLVASDLVSVLYRDVSDWSDSSSSGIYSGTWGAYDDFGSHQATEESGIWTLMVYYGGRVMKTTPVDVTVSYRTSPYSSGSCYGS